MDYGFKPTTNGRAVIAACGALEKPLRITRVAVGSGMAPEGVNLADVHELYQYVTEGTVSERRHENDRLYLTVQYSNSEPKEHRDVPTFTLSEFIVYAEHPETGVETDLLYATLGDYRQPVPQYREGLPGSVFNYPMVIIVSDEIKVEIAAAPGLVTWDEFETALAEVDATRVVVSREPPEKGPALWFCDGDYKPSPGERVVTLVLGEETDESDVLVNLDGKDHPVTNATREATESGETDVTIH